MNGIDLRGVVGKQDEADVVVGLAGKLKLGESVLAGVAAVLAPHREFDGVRAGVRSVTRVLQCLTEKVVIGRQISVAASNLVVFDFSCSQNGRHEQTGQGEGRNFLLANHDCSLKKELNFPEMTASNNGYFLLTALRRANSFACHKRVMTSVDVAIERSVV